MTFPGGGSGESGENAQGDTAQPRPAPAADEAAAAVAQPAPFPEFEMQPGAPAGYPPPGYGGPYPGYAPLPPRTNSLAIGSLVVSLLGLVPFCGGPLSIVGIGLGAIALKQIKKSGEKGHGAAVAGIAISAATLLLGLVLTIYLEPHWS